MELVFKALADSTRRRMLDELFGQDGQTLGALAGRFAMSRVAVAKHLGLLEGAGLVVTHRRGREKLHYLNAVPIRLIYDRWVSKYTETWSVGLVELKHDLEATPEKVFEIPMTNIDPTRPAHDPKENPMSATRTHITGVRTVSVPVANQDTALDFYVGTLGFTTVRDATTPNGGRWIELAPGDDAIIVTLEPAAADISRGAIGIRFSTDDAEAAHAALRAAGVDTDEILRWPGVPPMFAFRDPDGNAFSITELA